MELNLKIILTIIYIIISLFTGYALLKKIKKNKRVAIIDFFNIYYILIYFIVPIFYLYNSTYKFQKKYAIFLTYEFKYHVISLLCALLFYLILNFSYKKFVFKFKKENEINLNSKKFLFLNILFSIIGIFSYYMWTKIYGFPFGILKYADLLRDNKIAVNNPFTFFQPFCNFALFASYNWFILIKEYKNKYNKLLALVFFIFTFSFSILTAFANDSRNSIITLFLVPIIYIVNHKKIDFKKIALLGILSIIVLGNLDNLTYYIRNNSFKENYETSNVVDLLSYEFGFTYANRINLLDNIEKGNVKLTIITDIENIILSWVPKSMKPSNLLSLGKYNTSLYSYASGVIPTDIVSASIYKGRFLGIILLPLFISFILKFFDDYFVTKNNNFYKMIFYYFCIVINLRLVGYYDLSEILFSKFALIIYFYTISFFCKNKLKNYSEQINS